MALTSRPERLNGNGRNVRVGTPSCPEDVERYAQILRAAVEDSDMCAPALEREVGLPCANLLRLMALMASNHSSTVR